MFVLSQNHVHLEESKFNNNIICLFISFSVCTLFLLFCINLGFEWYGNDDASVSFFLVQNDYSLFQWRILTSLIHKLNVLFPIANWWAICSVFAIWLGAVSSLYVIYSRYPVWFSILFTCLYCLLLWYVTLHQINFTRTATVVSMGGIMLIADSLFFQKSLTVHHLQYFVGCLLLLLGASIRVESALVTLGYLACIGFVRLLSNSFSFRKQWFHTNRRQIIFLFATAVLFFSARMINFSLLTPEQMEYYHYNNLRASIQDYTANFPPYEAIQNECSSVGISSGAYQLFLNWMSEDTEVFSDHNLQYLLSLSNQTGLSLKPTLMGIIEMTKIPSLLFCSIVLLLSIIRKQNLCRNLFVLVFSYVVAIVLMKLGRFPIHVYLSLLWIIVMSCVFLSGNDWKDEKEDILVVISNQVIINVFIKHRLFAAVLATCLICSGFLSIKYYKYSGNYKAMMLEQQLARTQSRSAMEQIDQDESHIYIMDIMHNPASLSTAFDWGEPYPASYCTNLFGLGGWNARHPHNVARLNDYGIKNPVRALYERTDVYSAYSERILNYLRSDYDATITCTQVGTLADAPLVQYTAHIPDSMVTEYSGNSVVIDYLTPTEDGLLSLSAATESENRERIFYINITVDDQRYTYRLAYDNGILSGILYDIDTNAELNHSDMIIFEQTEDRYIGYNVVWQ